MSGVALRVGAVITAIAVTACAAGGRPDRGAPSSPAGAPSLVPVVGVVDGDTIAVDRGGEERVRLIGIDAPEVPWYGSDGECFGEEAGRFLRGLLAGRRVRLELDRERLDPYGRTLAYAHLQDGRMVNLLLVRRGYAIVTIYEPNDRHERLLRAAEREAREAASGLWGACDRPGS